MTQDEYRILLRDYNQSLTYHARVSGRYKYFCMTVPKSACTTLKAVLLEIEDEPLPNNISGFHLAGTRLDDLPDHIGIEALTNWYKFAFVRNPYSRILSAYKSKIISDKDGAYQKVRDNIGPIDFGGFVEWVSRRPDELRDPHWRSQTNILMTHILKYDFIGMMEFFTIDLNFVLAEIGAPTYGAFDKLNKTEPIENPYTPEIAEMVYSIYEKDFAFGYDWESYDLL